MTQLKEKSAQLEDLTNLKAVLERQLGNLLSSDGADGERRARLAASIDQINGQIHQMQAEIAEAQRSLKVMGLEPSVLA